MTPGSTDESEALELFSEVIAKLLGVSGVETEQDTAIGSDIQRAWTMSDDPKSDKRVKWLIDEIGGSQALKHRYEDIRRRRHGGKWRQDGYRHVQLGLEHIENLSIEPADPRHDDDIRQIWQGVLAMAQSEFDSEADVSILLNLMARDSDIQAGFDAAWPITQMVNTLNQSHPNPPWNDDRVENAKKRLKNWIVRLRRTHGLDETDLMDLFARHARTQASVTGPLQQPLGQHQARAHPYAARSNHDQSCIQQSAGGAPCDRRRWRSSWPDGRSRADGERAG